MAHKAHVHFQMGFYIIQLLFLLQNIIYKICLKITHVKERMKPSNF